MIEKDVLKGRRISVIGAGVSGSALAELAVKLGADVFVSDAKELKPETAETFKKLGIAWEESGNTERLLDADEIVVSSGISPENPMLVEAAERGMTITGELDFVHPYLEGIIIAVTGSNGKTTTTSMIGHFLEKCGFAVLTGGNIGNAVARAADGVYDFIVLELSSFQLYWAKTFRCDIAIVTNLAPDHINWHGSYENYVAAKANLFNCLYEGGSAIYQKRDESALNPTVKKKFPLSWGDPVSDNMGIYMDEYEKAAYINGGSRAMLLKLFDFSDVHLLGTHNLENTAMAMAIIALFNITNCPRDIISSYVPPKHRCAFAGKVKNVTFVDDSKGTNVAATVTAMSALPGPKVIILGGQGKGEEYGPLAEAAKKYTKFAVLLGSEKEKIEAALKEVGYTAYKLTNTMEDAVNEAYAAAEDGDTVLLSPACTSWDMYPSYNARGDHFCEIVKDIIARES